MRVLPYYVLYHILPNKINPKATNSFDCKGRCLTHPTNHWSGYNPLYDIWPPSSKRCIAQSYPYCKDVDDLRARDALATPCRDRLDPGVYNQTAFHMTDATQASSGRAIKLSISHPTASSKGAEPNVVSTISP